MKAIVLPSDFRHDPLTISGIVDPTVQDYRVNGRRNLQLLLYRRKHIDREIGHVVASDANYLLFEAYKLRRTEQGAKRATTNWELASVKTGFRVAKKAGLIKVVPDIDLFVIGDSNARTGFLFPDQSLKLLRELPGEVSRYSEFALRTGCRRGEVRHLDWPNVDQTEWVARVFSWKGGKSRARLIPLVDDRVKQIIEKQERVRDNTHDLVFHWDGRMIKEFRKTWKAALRRAGLPETVIFHDLRRSFCRNAWKAGTSDETIMKLVGHSTRQMLRRYRKYLSDDLIEAAKKIEEYLRKRGA